MVLGVGNNGGYGQGGAEAKDNLNLNAMRCMSRSYRNDTSKGHELISPVC